jgi:hypothetical protein
MKRPRQERRSRVASEQDASEALEYSARLLIAACKHADTLCPPTDLLSALGLIHTQKSLRELAFPHCDEFHQSVGGGRARVNPLVIRVINRTRIARGWEKFAHGDRDRQPSSSVETVAEGEDRPFISPRS